MLTFVLGMYVRARDPRFTAVHEVVRLMLMCTCAVDGALSHTENFFRDTLPSRTYVLERAINTAGVTAGVKSKKAVIVALQQAPLNHVSLRPHRSPFLFCARRKARFLLQLLTTPA